MYKINLLFIIFVGLLASCYSKPISIITEETIRPPLSLNLPPPIELKNMEFYILKRENALKIFDKLEKNKKMSNREENPRVLEHIRKYEMTTHILATSQHVLDCST